MLFAAMSPQLRQFLQFLFVGAINAVIDLGALNIFLHIWPTSDDRLLVIFNSLAYLLAILNSYVWNSRLTFGRHARKDLREKTYFLLQAGASLVLSNVTFLVSLHMLTFLNVALVLVQNISKLLAMAVPSIASFVFMKYFVFRRYRRA
ncbi:MAG: GtrA family protein [Peptococcaceae bacterium]|nr:GtrA family protein [Peptococcaceae bacterium]